MILNPQTKPLRDRHTQTRAGRTSWFKARFGAVCAAIALSIVGFAPAVANAVSKELERTWVGGFVYYPSGGVVTAGRIGDHMDGLSALPAGMPVVVYMHGCAGINQTSAATAKYYADSGFAVVLPNSFARRNKPTSCDPSVPRGGMHREVLGWRHAEMAHAINQVRRLPGGANRPLVLHGFSEGAITVATFEGAHRHSARIIEGWTCHSLWPEYQGLKAASSDDTLALVGEKDPWFQKSYLKGHCGKHMTSPRHRSVVFSAGDALSKEHYLFWSQRVRNLVDDFLATSLGSSG